jgi:hypothetical protein
MTVIYRPDGHATARPIERVYASERAAWVVGDFLARVVARARGTGGSAWAVSALGPSASFSARRLLSARAGVKVGLCPFGADAECVAGLFQGGDACIGGGGELVECLPVVGPDAGGFVGCGGLGMVGVLDGGDLGPVCLRGVVLGLLGACGGVGDLAGGLR